jgi:hypothetical protein
VVTEFSEELIASPCLDMVEAPVLDDKKHGSFITFHLHLQGPSPGPLFFLFQVQTFFL